MNLIELPLVLGPVLFEGFELPGHITVAGRQRLAVHRLLDGSRIVDVLGPDENDISWSGVMTGPLAAERAQVLDALRLAGEPHELLFGNWFTTVVVSAFAADANLAGWIPYRVACTVVAEPVAPDPVLTGLALVAWAGEPAGVAGLGAADLATVVGAAGALAAATAVRSVA